MSSYIPKALAAWAIFASALLAICSFALVSWPSTSDFFYFGMIPMFIYEVTLGFWLLFKGVAVTARNPT